MAPRASWKGYLKLSLVSCPVALFPATTMAERVRFRTINRQTGNRIRQQLVDEATGEPVEPEDRVKGYEVGKSDYVIVEDEELEAVQIESSHTIDIQRFVKIKDVDPLYLDEGYYLAPDDRVAVEPFSVIREAMRSTGTVGIAKVAMYRREKLLLLEPRGNGLLGKTIRYGYEVRGEDSYFADIPDVKIDPELLDLAEHIVGSKMGKFDPATFEDRYEDAIVEMIKAKRAGHKPKLAPAAAPPSNVVNLMDALRRSLAGGDGKEAGEAAGKPKKAAATKTEKPEAAEKPKSKPKTAKATGTTARKTAPKRSAGLKKAS
jgi:DNA end-binding protein Ku